MWQTVLSAQALESRATFATGPLPSLATALSSRRLAKSKPPSLRRWDRYESPTTQCVCVAQQLCGIGTTHVIVFAEAPTKLFNFY